LLVRRQLTAISPLLPVDLLRIPIFTMTVKDHDLTPKCAQ
jgi:hypothetical protein